MKIEQLQQRERKSSEEAMETPGGSMAEQVCTWKGLRKRGRKKGVISGLGQVLALGPAGPGDGETERRENEGAVERSTKMAEEKPSHPNVVDGADGQSRSGW
ncbi:predicted protein [Verticillium alfalfae VaMs.102]|uniref:Predicted protein n=1 Tax=Verticillium alfalfae (strain VaMs.102 / ATCC MYA-4576 / FGSC 10136) TaxID=526221 RepID=C9S536_VERA1|nr:predicted protein [Verticillium alfalfae VaMs.102]EEY14136.1 predicted protein [Verticillium alfalfae VaMs.102]